MATHSSLLAWRIVWTGEPGGLQSMESQRVRHSKHTFANVGDSQVHEEDAGPTLN